MTELLPSDPEYVEVEHHARKVVMKSPVKILSITHVENPHLYSLYSVMRDQINHANGPDVENERLLWHGTSSDTVSIICNRGFNRSYCGKMRLLLVKACTSLKALDTRHNLSMQSQTATKSAYFPVPSANWPLSRW